MKGDLDIACPVLVISAASQQGTGHGGGRHARAAGAVRLGQHVTWLYLDEPAPGHALAAHGRDAADPASNQRLLFDEMGRWLGAYMYGKARDQLI
jgi:hypothetical protein